MVRLLQADNVHHCYCCQCYCGASLAHSNELSSPLRNLSTPLQLFDQPDLFQAYSCPQVNVSILNHWGQPQVSACFSETASKYERKGTVLCCHYAAKAIFNGFSSVNETICVYGMTLSLFNLFNYYIRMLLNWPWQDSFIHLLEPQPPLCHLYPVLPQNLTTSCPGGTF